MDNIPKQIGKYEVTRRLGRGGMAIVYHGLDRELSREVAIKVRCHLNEDDENRERLEAMFLREARAAAQLRHDNIVSIYEIGNHEGQPFIAMEYVDGTSLANVIHQREPKPLHEKLTYIEQICDGLGHAHLKGIVHRDIKPPNLMLDRANQIRIVDFGIVHLQDSGMTTPGAVIGTYNYMSPEQLGGMEVDTRSDIFSLGAVAYELLAYQQAFPGRNLAELSQRICHKDPRPLADFCPGLPGDLETIVLRALAKHPEDRFADLTELRLAIRHVQRDLDPRFELKTIFVQQVKTVLTPSGTPRGSRASSVASAGAVSGVAVTDASGGFSAPTLDVISRDGKEKSSRRWLRPLIGVLSLAIVALMGVWFRNGPPFASAPAPTAPSTETAVPVAVPAPGSATPATNTPDPAPPVSAPVPVAKTPAPAAKTPDPAAKTPAPAAKTPNPAASTPGPAGSTSGGAANAPSPPDGPAIRPPSVSPDLLARINAALSDNNVAGALVLIAPALDDRPDERADAVARRIVESAFDVMAVAENAATTRKASDLAGTPFSAGRDSKMLAERAFKRNDYVQAGKQALAAAASFRIAERDALAAAAPKPPPPAPEPDPKPAVAKVPEPPPPVTPVAPKVPQLDSAGILSALNRYKSAYSARNVDEIRKVYPSLPQQEITRLRRNFNTCREVNVNFSGIQTSPVADDPTSAVVTVRSTYFCQPRINAPAQEVPQEDVFRLRNVGGTWLIDRMGAMDPLR